MPPESLLLCLRTDSDLSHEVPAGRHHPGRHHPTSMAACAGVHEKRRIWQQGPVFTFPSVLLVLQQLHRGPLEQPVGLPQHHTRPRRGGRRDAAWHPGRFIASSTTTQHGTKQHGAQPELSVQLVRCSHTAHPDASPSLSTRSRDRELGQWADPPPSSVDWDAELIQRALQHHLRIPFLAQDTQCPLCGQVLDGICEHAGGLLMRMSLEKQTRWATSPTKLPRKQASALEKRKKALLVQPCMDTEGLPSAPAATAPPMCRVWVYQAPGLKRCQKSR